jgi:3-hydroxybutyryl-CoA dehydrogenase
MKNIGIVGAGTMGNGIAHVFAQSGYNVRLMDANPAQLAKAVQNISKNFDRQISKNTSTEAEKTNALSRITIHQHLTSGLSESDLVIEAAIENADLKFQIFKQIDELAPPGCILASNTSSISITKIAAATNRPNQVIGMHFMNPVPIMRLVEVINGYLTDQDTTKAIVALCKDLGKVPCVVKDYPGFIANRILLPMINEAISSLFQGVAGVEEIDTVMKLGMAHPMGPLQLADFIGLDVCLAILDVLHVGFGDSKYAPCPLLTNMVNAGFLGVKSGEGFYKYAPGSKEMKVSSRFV